MKKAKAVFTLSRDESRFLPLWVSYYRRYFGIKDIYVLDHDSVDDSIKKVAGSCQVIPVYNSVSFDHMWMLNLIQNFQEFLLHSYESVLFAEVDEIIAPEPTLYPAGLGQYIECRFLLTEYLAVRCQGYEVVHIKGEEPALSSAGLPMLRKRKYWAPSKLYSKVLLSKVPLFWSLGFHDIRLSDFAPLNDPDLVLLHLHRVDWDWCKERHRKNTIRVWSQHDVNMGRGMQNALVEDKELEEWFYHPEKLKDYFEPLHLETIPPPWRDVI